MRIIFTITIILIFSCNIRSQSLLIQKSNDSLVTIQIADIDSIYFVQTPLPTDTVIITRKKDGSFISIKTVEIDSMYFVQAQLPADTIITTDVQFLGHKGGGSTGYNYHYIENTLPSIKDGLQTMNGIETDVQMSLDGTPWLIHTPDIATEDCDTSFHHCLVLLHDSVISKIQLCKLGLTDRLYKLSELIDYWDSTASGFYISLHIKQSGDIPKDSLSLIGGQKVYLSKLADALANVLAVFNHPGKLMMEVNDTAFCHKIKKSVPGAKICLLEFKSFSTEINDALKWGYDGISCNYTDTAATAARIKTAQQSGLIVQMWTPWYVNELLYAWNKHPNTIQTDKLAAISELYMQIVPPTSGLSAYARKD